MVIYSVWQLEIRHRSNLLRPLLQCIPPHSSRCHATIIYFWFVKSYLLSLLSLNLSISLPRLTCIYSWVARDSLCSEDGRCLLVHFVVLSIYVSVLLQFHLCLFWTQADKWKSSEPPDVSVQLFRGPIVPSWEGAFHFHCGMKNLHNSCYLNATVQVCFFLLKVKKICLEATVCELVVFFRPFFTLLRFLTW